MFQILSHLHLFIKLLLQVNLVHLALNFNS
nr:MAG TPA: hypothetical protein [Crassvirales sp.]